MQCKVLQINDKSSNSANASWDNTVQTANRWEYHTVCDLPPVIWYGGSESTSGWKGSKFHGYSRPKTAALPVKRNSQTRASLFSPPFIPSTVCSYSKVRSLVCTLWHDRISPNNLLLNVPDLKELPCEKLLVAFHFYKSAISHHRPPFSKVISFENW